MQQNSDVKFKKTYLVTGGCGFIGSHLVDTLTGFGHRVIVVDNLSTGKLQNLNAQAELLIGDVRDALLMGEVLAKVDGCFHLAAIASVEKANQEWSDTHSINLSALINIFEALALKGRHIPVVYTSSAAVYGDSVELPIAETSPTLPLSAYGADKLGCDLHGKVAAYIHRIDNIGVRPFNIYGPRQDPASPYSGVISIFADRMIKNQTVTIYGDGRQERDFVFVSDAVKVFYTAMAHLEQRTIKGHELFNICTGRATSINLLATTLSQLIGFKSGIVHGEPRSGDIRHSIGNPDKLRELLGLRLQTPLSSGLAQTVDAIKTAPVNNNQKLVA